MGRVRIERNKKKGKAAGMGWIRGKTLTRSESLPCCWDCKRKLRNVYISNRRLKRYYITMIRYTLTSNHERILQPRAELKRAVTALSRLDYHFCTARCRVAFLEEEIQFAPTINWTRHFILPLVWYIFWNHLKSFSLMTTVHEWFFLFCISFFSISMGKKLSRQVLTIVRLGQWLIQKTSALFVCTK